MKLEKMLDSKILKNYEIQKKQNNLILKKLPWIRNLILKQNYQTSPKSQNNLQIKYV